MDAVMWSHLLAIHECILFMSVYYEYGFGG